MTTYVKRSQHKLLGEQSLKIKKVFNNYRSGWVEVAGKYVARSFIYFPKRLTEDMVVSWDERAKLTPQDEGNMELREKKWNKEARQFEFYKVTDKLDREFFAAYKKVYDIEIVTSKDITLPLWDSASRTEVPTLVPANSEVILKEFPASRLKALLEALDLDGSIQLVDGKDKAGNPAKVKPYDWEDDVKDLLNDKFFSFKVRGEGLDTTFTFKEAKEFEVANVDSAQEVFDVPTEPATKQEIDVNDLPFN